MNLEPTGLSDQPRIEVHDDAATLATSIAGELLNRIADTQAAGRVPQIGLTGGSIADAVHREVARLADAAGVDWSAVDFWFGDERFVPADSPDRNVGQARRAFLDAVGATRVHEVAASDQVATAEEAAAAYATEVKKHGAGGFDVLMLGVGPDGHIASLFPHHPGLEVTDAMTTAVHDSPKPPPDRITFTFEALERSRAVWFLVAGEEKSDAVARALATEGSRDGTTIADTPARGVVGTDETVWFLDHPAASLL